VHAVVSTKYAVCKSVGFTPSVPDSKDIIHSVLKVDHFMWNVFSSLSLCGYHMLLFCFRNTTRHDFKFYADRLV